MIFLVFIAAGIIALSVAAYLAKRTSSKAMILGALGLLILLIWANLVLALGVLSAHELPETVARWPSPLALAAIGFAYFAAVASFAFLRKLD